jgi:hypothetical protein
MPPAQNGIIQGPGCPAYAAGLVYDGDGDIIDPTIPAILGRLGAAGSVSPGPEIGLAYMVGGDLATSAGFGAARIMSFDLTTRSQLQSVTLPVISAMVTYGRMVHWGQDGVGFFEIPSTYNPSNPNPGPFAWIHLVHLPAAQ